jgi:phosphate transport system substrate-binding protein
MSIFSSLRGGRQAALAGLVGAGLLLSACGDNAAPAAGSAAPTSTPAAAAGAATNTPAAAAAPTNTPVQVGSGSVLLNGAGATFPVPIYSKWFQTYSTTVDKNVAFNYQPIGSGGGISAITAKTVDFAGSDAPLSDDQLAKAPGLLHIPTVAGAVVLAYNVEGLTGDLVLDGDTVAGIFLGNITRWNDPKIAALNAGVTLPDADIAVVHRSDGSGTTNIFTGYLSAVSADWQTKVGAGTAVNWPVGLGGKGNPGVAGLVKQTAGSIGYVELAYAEQNKIPYTRLKNKAGQVVSATIDATNAAANGISIPADFRVSIVNSADPAAWPIAGFTYVLVYQDLNNIKDAAKAKALVDYLWWATHDGEALAKDLLYAKPSADLTAKIETELRSITFNGQPVLSK